MAGKAARALEAALAAAGRAGPQRAEILSLLANARHTRASSEANPAGVAEAAALADEAARQAGERRAPRVWAEAQVASAFANLSLGKLFFRFPTGPDRPNPQPALERAVAAARQALKAFSEQGAPGRWARAQVCYAQAHVTLGQLLAADWPFQEAVDSYRLLRNRAEQNADAASAMVSAAERRIDLAGALALWMATMHRSDILPRAEELARDLVDSVESGKCPPGLVASALLRAGLLFAASAEASGGDAPTLERAARLFAKAETAYLRVGDAGNAAAARENADHAAYRLAAREAAEAVEPVAVAGADAISAPQGSGS